MPYFSDYIKEDDHVVFIKTRENIFQLRTKHDESYSEYKAKLSQGERAVLLISVLIWEVVNGGLKQFLENSSGDRSEETRWALKAIGADTEQQLLTRIAREVFENDEISTDRKLRCDKLWDEEENSATQGLLLTQFNEVVGFGERLEGLMAAYIRRNPDEFTL